jgi:hypothetical protein
VLRMAAAVNLITLISIVYFEFIHLE